MTWLGRVAGVGVALVLMGLVAVFLVPLPTRLDAPGARLVLYDDGSVAHAFLAPDGRFRVSADLDEVDPRYVEALLAVEDRRFYVHPGVDPIAVTRAAIDNLRAGRVVSGASTLTMQVTRMAEPKPRTFRAKLIEVARALQLEIRLTKREILEAYLTLVPYGRNLEGIEAGALATVGHRPDALSDAEIALLLAIPQNPSHRYPSPDHTPALRRARDRVVDRLAATGRLDLGGRTTDAAISDLEGTSVPEALRPRPADVPHAAAYMAGRSGASRIRTTLQRGVSNAVIGALQRFRRRVPSIDNGAVVVIDHHTGAVKALIGNFDFFDERGGQIPSFAVPRSPGSALKPVLYAMAIDRGLVLPEHRVLDVPVRYGHWTPANYDGTYAGMVVLEDALSQSLNIPFVRLLDDVGVEAFLGQLRGMGVGSLNPTPGHYGLSAIAGATEITLIELGQLYTAFATDGHPVRVTLRPGNVDRRHPRAFSAGAAWLTRRALRRRDRPDFPDRNSGVVVRNVHWKTGTSYGNRDAVAVGSGTDHTIAVWLGNLDNRSSFQLVGSTAAGTVLFDAFDAMGEFGPADDPQPDDLHDIEVCSLSGHRPTAACAHRLTVPAPERIPGGSCTLHQAYELDVASGERVVAGCREGRKVESRVAVVWPPQVRRYLDQRHEPSLPRLAEACTPVDDVPPRIVTPPQDVVVRLLPGLAPDEQRVALNANSADDVVSWFVDGRFLGRVASEDTLWWTPSPGRHTIVVQNAAGQADQRSLTVH